MASAKRLDRIFHYILESFVRRGQAPHYTEIAQAFSVSQEEGKQLLHELMTAELAAWLHPGTDLIASFAPFNNLPTQYRLTIGGQQKWFAQCGLEALAVGWLFPGQEIQIDTTCLDCGEPIRIGLRDGVIQDQDPTGIYGYVDIPFREWRQNWPYACGRINLFRSEEHARRWSGFKAEAESGLISLADMLAIVTHPLFQERLNGHYISGFGSLRQQFVPYLRKVTHDSPFWDPVPR